MFFVLRSSFFAACLVASACASAGLRPDGGASGLIHVGVAQIDITPDEPIRLTGYGNRTAPSERVGQRLRAKALAFGRDHERPAVLIAADLIGVPRRLTEDLARRLQKAGVASSDLAVSATHTHTGPSIAGVLPFIFSTPVTADEQNVIDRYSAVVADKLERVALAALADRRPARVAWGQGTASFAANRRVLKEGRWIAFGVQADGAVDRDLPMLAVRGIDGALRAVLATYACHATTLEGRDNFVHGDWPGVAQELIEQRHPGAIAIVTIATGADANPNPRGGGLADVERHGREFASEVTRLLSSALRPIVSPPFGRTRTLQLTLAPIPGRAEWNDQAAQKGPRGALARSIVARLDRGDPMPTAVSYPVQTWSFGDDLAMIFLGGEVVADYGLRLKRELDPTRLWIHAYSNDVAFYVPSRRMIAEGGYEVEGSMVYYGHPARLAETSEDQIVRAVHDLLPRAGRFSRVRPHPALF